MKHTFKLLCAALVSAVSVIMFNVMTVFASSIPAGDISIDYNTQKLTVKESSADTDLQIYFSVPKLKSVKKKQEKVLAASEWDIYDYDQAAGLTIDLSHLNRTKDNYIQLKGDKAAEPVTIKIPAVLSKVSAAFDAVNAAVVLNDTSDKKKPVPVTDMKLEYKTANSNWHPYSDDDLSIYQERGAALYFRITASESESLQADDLTLLTNIVDSDGRTVQAYSAGRFPGKEVKVSIGKRAPAPTVKVDYNKHLFTLPKNAEYRVVTSSAVSKWIQTDKKSLSLSEISAQTAGVSSAILEVRTIASKNKPASKARRIDFEMPQILEVYVMQGDADPSDLVSADILFNGVGKDEIGNAQVEIGYEFNKKTKEYIGIRVYNHTNAQYELYISKDGSLPSSESTGLCTVKALTKNSDLEKGAETIISSKKVKVGDRIYIRRKADTKNGIFSSEFAGFGTIAYTPDDRLT